MSAWLPASSAARTTTWPASRSSPSPRSAAASLPASASCSSPASCRASAAAASLPVEQAILVDTFPPAKRASAFALYTVAIVTAPAIGPVLGGWITDNYNWRWVFLINIPIGILSLFLTNKFVHDPPAFAGRAQDRPRKSASSASTASASPSSPRLGRARTRPRPRPDRRLVRLPFICWMFVIAVAAWAGAVFWELNHPDPVIDFRLLKNRNFAIANAFYFVFGVGLFATTTMIPQILQSLYGYRAIDAGLVLGPGAFVITLLAPVGAQLVQRGIVHPKRCCSSAPYASSGSLDPLQPLQSQTDYNHYAWARALQGLGYAFFFVPLSVIAYSQLARQNNRASSLTNFFRNWGGSFGIAFVTTVSERRQDFHQAWFFSPSRSKSAARSPKATDVYRQCKVVMCRSKPLKALLNGKPV
jgi:DHA2 family multidrug resistance protein